MPRQQAVVPENNFVGGLITESTALRFPPNACTDADNVIFSFTGEITRRKGFVYESDYTLNAITSGSGDAYTEYLWTAISGDGSINFLVQQQGATIHFFDIRDNITPSSNKKSFTIDLTDYLPVDSAYDPSLYAVQYAQIKGNLIIVHSKCEAFYISYSIVSDTITVNQINIMQRDLIGLDDGLSLTERLALSVTGLQSGNPEHYYNILNQGWHSVDALSQWDISRTDVPSNADVVLLYRASETDAFDNSRVTSRSPGNTPAPKGHFILNVPNADRAQVLSDEGFASVSFTQSFEKISENLGTTIGDHTNASAAFDGVTAGDWNTLSTISRGVVNSTASYVGKNFSSNPQNIISCKVYLPANGGLVNTNNVGATIYLLGSNTLPANGGDGTTLGTITFTDSSSSGNHTITSSDLTTKWNYVWISIASGATPPLQHGISELEFYTLVATENEPNTVERASTVATFAGRVFYAGVNAIGLNSSIFFTQIIESNSQLGNCYQKQDPTSEDFADLLPDDGGVIKIPEIGSIIKLYPFQSSLLVLATNGVWRISGSTGASFKANDYQVKRLTSIGVNNSMAVVDFAGTPIWWAEDGIYSAKYNSNYDSFEVVNLTTETIASFFLSIPSINRQYAKGYYNIFDQTIYWLFNNTPGNTDHFSYNRVLCFGGMTKAFYPWSISTLEDGKVKGLCLAIDGSKANEARMKYTVAVDSNLVYAEHTSDSYKDWGTTNYSSYFITGWRVDGQGQKFFQPNYVFVYLNTITGSSCKFQALYDWTNSGNSGKWSSQQQVYNSALTYRDVNFRRLKVRGKGRAMQFKFISETDKPFHIIGWSIWESSNASI